MLFSGRFPVGNVDSNAHVFSCSISLAASFVARGSDVDVAVVAAAVVAVARRVGAVVVGLLQDAVLGVVVPDIDSPARRAGDDERPAGADCVVVDTGQIVVVPAAVAVAVGGDDNVGMGVENPSELDDWDERVGVEDVVDRNGDTDDVVGGVAGVALAEDDYCNAQSPSEENSDDELFPWRTMIPDVRYCLWVLQLRWSFYQRPNSQRNSDWSCPLALFVFSGLDSSCRSCCFLVEFWKRKAFHSYLWN